MGHKIIKLPVAKLKPNPNNPRLIKDFSFKSLVKSLKDCPELFDVRPCIASDRTGELVILGGNMRFRAAVELKWKEVPVIVMSGLSEEQEREIVIRDNGAWGEWDMSALSSSWADLPLNEMGVNLPEDWLKTIPEEKEENIVPDKDPNILVRVSFHPGIWLGKREEIMGIVEKLKKTYGCEVRIEE